MFQRLLLQLQPSFNTQIASKSWITLISKQTLHKIYPFPLFPYILFSTLIVNPCSAKFGYAHPCHIYNYYPNPQPSPQQMLKSLIKIAKFQIVNESKIINPYTHDPIKPRPYITDTELFERVTECSRDYRQWRKVDVQERKAKVELFVDSIVQDKEILKPMISQFTGKSYRNIDQQFRRIKNVITNLIQNSDIALKQQTKKTQFLTHNYSIKITQDPVGLAMIFPYYSQPIFDSLIHLIPCLISGNGALLKVSDYNHFLGEYMNKKCNQVLGYKNLINDAFIHPSQLPIVREFRPIKKLNFAGSRSSARRIFEVMVENRFIDCNLFYGAQEAAYVDQTADLELAADQICKNAFYNNGQSYDCIRRLYIHKDVSAKLVQMIADRMQKIKLGDPKAEDTDLGPITIQESVLRFEQLINDAINMDAKCIIGGMTTTDGKTKGIFCQPTLLTNCDPNMQVIQEQMNAPLLCVSTVEGFNNFQVEVEDNSYGTGIRIFTKEPAKYRNSVNDLQVGIISFNSGCIIDCDLPIEGWKGSGKGKILSELSYQEFVVPKCFIIHEP